MKFCKFISMLLLACAFYAGNAIAQAPQDAEAEATGRAIATEILQSQGFSEAEITKALQDLNDPKVNLSVCGACTKIESIIGDPDTTCGNNNNAITCGIYMGKGLYTYFQAHKAQVCSAITSQKTKVCGLGSSTLNTLLGKVCSGFKCS